MMDGYHAWRQFYNSLIGKIKINIPFGKRSESYQSVKPLIYDLILMKTSVKQLILL
ncbi:hypothetical protein M3C91_20250 [Oceanobacillus sojae]|nr:hypothetical protein [Oceanobacillus sojae]